MFQSCECHHNQTFPDCHKALAKDAAQLGTGLFVVPAPENGVPEWKIVRVPNLTYRECVKRGANCGAFQWVANSVKTYDELIKVMCTHSCPGSGYTCDQIGCTCYHGTCY
jgi:hypothetical protein